MKKLFIFLGLALLLCTLTACGKQSAARAERSKPRVSITSDSVTLRRVPAANAMIEPDGTLKIDDVALPQPDEKRAQLQLLFGHLQMLRQQAVAEAKPDPDHAAIPVATTPEIEQLKTELLQEIPPLQAYADSFGNLRAERR